MLKVKVVDTRGIKKVFFIFFLVVVVVTYFSDPRGGHAVLHLHCFQNADLLSLGHLQHYKVNSENYPHKPRPSVTQLQIHVHVL